jgi:hypothetical protein
MDFKECNNSPASRPSLSLKPNKKTGTTLSLHPNNELETIPTQKLNLGQNHPIQYILEPNTTLDKSGFPPTWKQIFMVKIYTPRE